MKTLLIHGGPGLNSKPEESILKNKLKAAGFEPIFWNEPRHFKTTDPYSEILKSIELLVAKQDEKLILIGHSSGCKNILNILPKIKEKVHAILFLSPALDFQEADDNIIELGLRLIEDDKTLNDLESLKSKLTPEFDGNKSQALLLAFSSNYFPLNFSSLKSFEKYFSYLTGENQFRIEDYIKIRKSIPNEITKSSEVFDIKLKAIFGKKDPVFDFEHGKKIINGFFSNSEIVCLDEVSHYPHIDATDYFLSSLVSLKN